ALHVALFPGPTPERLWAADGLRLCRSSWRLHAHDHGLHHRHARADRGRPSDTRQRQQPSPTGVDVEAVAVRVWAGNRALTRTVRARPAANEDILCGYRLLEHSNCNRELGVR